MSVSMSQSQPQPDSLPLDTAIPFPAPTKSATSQVLNTPTTAILTSFADKLVLTISQRGKLAQWFTVRLESENPSLGEGYLSLNSAISGEFDDGGYGGGGGGGYEDGAGAGDEEGGEARNGGGSDQFARLLSPQNRFVARTLLGAGGEREVWGGLVSRCVAGLVTARDAGESRVLVVAVGLVDLPIGGGGSMGVGLGVNGSGEGEDEEDDVRRRAFLEIIELVSRVL